MNNLEEEDIKIILLGEFSPGKTSLINTFLGIEYNDFETYPRHQVSFVDKFIIIEKKKYILYIWDTTSQLKFRSLTKIFIKNSKIVILVYDITSRISFEELPFWVKTCREILGDAIIGIIGNKQDLI